MDRRLEKSYKLSKLYFAEEVFEFFRVWLCQIVALREDFIDIHSMLPHQVFHAMSQTYLCRQRLRTFEVIELLKPCSLKFEGISALCRVQEMERMNSIIGGVVEILNGIFNPSFRKKRLPHISVKSKDDENLSVLVYLGVFLPEAGDCICCSLFNLVWSKVFWDLALV